MRACNIMYLCAICAILVGCGTKPIQPSDKHIQLQPGQSAAASGIPETVNRGVILPPPKPSAKVETYSVVVTNVPVQEILFALARDAKINLDVHAGIQGTATLNAINQTLPQILNRISKQVDMRYELENGNLSVMPDKPFLKTYKIDFINMARAVDSTMTTNTQIAGTAGDSKSSTTVTSKTKNDLMESLIDNVTKMILEEDRLRWKSESQSAMSAKSASSTKSVYKAKVNASGDGEASSGTGGNTNINTGIQTGGGNPKSGPNGSFKGKGNESLEGQSTGDTQSTGDAQGAAAARSGVYEAAVNVFANRETGVLLVRATTRQHEKVQEFIDMVMNTAKRQVLIEATIVEVRLSDNYKQGINWSQLRLGSKGLQLTQAGTAGLLSANPLNIFTLDYANPTSNIGNLSAQISLLESFGTVKVLSSPKLSVMNNQTATLKVADNKIYFTVTAQTSTSTTVSTGGAIATTPLTTYSTTPNSVSVGFVMNVTPQISDADTVTINVRPTITRIISYINDPNPDLAKAGVVNRVPEIQTREMESIIKINSGQTAVMGGLMQDEINNLTDAIPGVSNIPLLGNLFKNRNDTTTKTELVIFLRPVVIKEASVNGDYSAFRDNLPDANFFKPTPNNSEFSIKP